ncbi:hypothetical protein U7230_08010 [Carboxydochorda subterranea]|uniref:Stage II sporulation protein M n=1 Tax=Carboxydichorda subterranea TaxID=3109565 RepID=A0ABZ1BTE9_9FIRM|nr:hypothetical protein [Limnochorda sp. L945t]WRP16054.1 hypothetical protein U7230_08010 [Limnochorda sp. L945t]
MRLARGLLLHDSVWVRFLALWVGVAAAFVIAWVVSCAWLPEGMLRGIFPGSRLAGGATTERTFVAEWLRIAGVNLASAGLVTGVASLVETEGGFSLGYLVPLWNALLYGAFLGTNSFAIPIPQGRMAPSFVVFGRSGIYEITAYVLLAVSLRGLARYRILGHWWSFRQQLVRIEPPGLRRQEWLGVVLALALLLAANAREALQAMQLT